VATQSSRRSSRATIADTGELTTVDNKISDADAMGWLRTKAGTER